MDVKIRKNADIKHPVTSLYKKKNNLQNQVLVIEMHALAQNTFKT